MVLNNLQAICLLAQLLTKIGFKINKSKNSELKQLCILFEGELKNGTKKDLERDFSINFNFYEENWLQIHLEKIDSADWTCDDIIMLFSEEEFKNLDKIFETGNIPQFQKKDEKIKIPLTIKAITYFVWKISLWKLKCPINAILNPKYLIPDEYLDNLEDDIIPSSVKDNRNISNIPIIEIKKIQEAPKTNVMAPMTRALTYRTSIATPRTNVMAPMTSALTYRTSATTPSTNITVPRKNVMATRTNVMVPKTDKLNATDAFKKLSTEAPEFKLNTDEPEKLNTEAPEFKLNTDEPEKLNTEAPEFKLNTDEPEKLNTEAPEFEPSNSNTEVPATIDLLTYASASADKPVKTV